MTVGFISKMTVSRKEDKGENMTPEDESYLALLG